MSSSAFEELEYQQLVRHPELAQQLKQALSCLPPVKIENRAYEQAAPIKLGDYTHLHIHQYRSDPGHRARERFLWHRA